MLSDLLLKNVDVIAERTRARVRSAERPTQPLPEIIDGVQVFLTQVAETLKEPGGDRPSPLPSVRRAAIERGAALSAAGFTPGEIVHDYGAICQSVTEVADEHEWPITAVDFQVLNGCLDDAIAAAVSEHARLTARRFADEELERLGQAAHELRDALNSAVLAFHSMRKGGVDAAGPILGRSLTDLQTIIDRTLSQVRLASGGKRPTTLSVKTLCEEVSAVAALHSQYRGIHFIATPVPEDLSVNGDPQLLASATMNLLHNAFKNTRQGGTVRLRAAALDGHVRISVEDECGGLPPTTVDLFKPFGDRRGQDRSGLGLGLSIARRAVQSHGGEITVTNAPGVGCIFTIDLPLTGRAEG